MTYNGQTWAITVRCDKHKLSFVYEVSLDTPIDLYRGHYRISCIPIRDDGMAHSLEVDGTPGARARLVAVYP